MFLSSSEVRPPAVIDDEFRLNKFVQKIDLAPEGLVPVECRIASWNLNIDDYLTWKKAKVNGYGRTERG